MHQLDKNAIITVTFILGYFISSRYLNGTHTYFSEERTMKYNKVYGEHRF